jgi:hypothetical protein
MLAATRVVSGDRGDDLMRLAVRKIEEAGLHVRLLSLLLLTVTPQSELDQSFTSTQRSSAALRVTASPTVIS